MVVVVASCVVRCVILIYYLSPTLSNHTYVPTKAPSSNVSSYCRTDICDDYDNDCCVSANETMICSLSGYTVMPVNSSFSVAVNETSCHYYHCCITDTKNDQDGGNDQKEEEEDTCSQDYCKSRNCYAGSWSKPCECSEGVARETGKTIHYNGEKHHEYTCCVNGFNEGRECGEYNESLFLTIVIAVPIILLVALSYCCYFCYKVRKNAPWHYKYGFLRRKNCKHNNFVPTAQQHHCQHQRVPFANLPSTMTGRALEHTNGRGASPFRGTVINIDYDRHNHNCFICPHCGAFHNGVRTFCVICGFQLVGTNVQPLIPRAVKLT